MKKYNILVTGIGAIIGYGVIKSLRNSKYDVNIIGMDIYDDAVGKNWVDTFIQAIPAKSEQYIGFLKDIIEEYKIDLVIFGTEQEIQKVSTNREELGTDIDKLILNKEFLVELAQDKWQTYKYLEEHGIKTIDSMIECDYEEAKDRWGTPFLLKPRQSYASKGIVKIVDKEEFDFWKKKNGKNFMVQEIIGDDEHEYTTGLFGLGDGTYINSITFQRKLSQEGSTAKAKVVRDSALEEQIKLLTQLFKPVGPTNYQFRLHQGNYILLEINPRISSSTSLRTPFGYNEAEMCIEFFVEKKKPSLRKIKDGYAVRYIDDMVTYL